MHAVHPGHSPLLAALFARWLTRRWSLRTQATFIAERAISITANEVRTKTHTFVLENPAIDATGFDMKKSVAGGLFEFIEGHCGTTAKLTNEDESTRYARLRRCGWRLPCNPPLPSYPLGGSVPVRLFGPSPCSSENDVRLHAIASPINSSRSAFIVARGCGCCNPGGCVHRRPVCRDYGQRQHSPEMCCAVALCCILRVPPMRLTVLPPCWGPRRQHHRLGDGGKVVSDIALHSRPPLRPILAVSGTCSSAART